MTYTLRVVPVNSIGQPHTSPIISITTPPAPPSQPLPPQLQNATSSSITLFLTAPASILRGNDPSSISFYLQSDSVVLGEMDGESITTPTVTFKHLKPACCYHFRMAVCTPHGNSPLSALLTAATKPTTPEAPQRLRQETLDAVYSPLSFLKVAWDPPFCDNGSEVTQYVLEMATMKKDGKLTPYASIGTTSDTAHILSDLLAGCSYSVRIQAVNSFGAGPLSNPLLVTTGANPPEACDMPQLLKRPTGKVVVVGWSEPTANGSPIVGYIARVEPIHREYHLSGNDHSLQIKQLQPSTEYSITVCAVNAVGEGPASEALVVQTDEKGLTPPPPPKFKPVMMEGETAIVRWEEVKCEECEVLNYQLFSENRLVCEGLNCKYRFNAVIGQHYVFQVKAVNIIGASPLSEECEVYVPPPVVVKEVKPRELSNPKAAKKQFANAGNSMVDSVLDKKRKKAWIVTWWRENSVLIAVIAIIIGIIVLARTTMNWCVCCKQ